MGDDLLSARVADIMTRRPKTVAPHMLASAAIELLNASRITALLVVDKGKPSASCTCTICCGPAWLQPRPTAPLTPVTFDPAQPADGF
jgi:hypothetical protein